MLELDEVGEGDKRVDKRVDMIWLEGESDRVPMCFPICRCRAAIGCIVYDIIKAVQSTTKDALNATAFNVELM